MSRPTLPLLAALLMFPQLAETLYSPALPAIASRFQVDAAAAGQTLSWYFVAFAVGTVLWGRLCDRIGRRATLLWGLGLYLAAASAALVIRDFELFLLMRMLSALGAAVGSIVTQTMLRDLWQGEALAARFAQLGLPLALSPALGALTGALLMSSGGLDAALSGLALLAALLLVWSALGLTETRPPQQTVAPVLSTLRRMLTDPGVLRIALQVGVLNVSLFAYYQLAPFQFEAFGAPTLLFGLSGGLVAAAVWGGAWLNRLLRARIGRAGPLLWGAFIWLGGCGLLSLWAGAQLWAMVPAALAAMAYGAAIPNLLAAALADYEDCRGTAGALLGLGYYLVLAAGLGLSRHADQLGWVLLACAALVLLAEASRIRRPTFRTLLR